MAPVWVPDNSIKGVINLYVYFSIKQSTLEDLCFLEASFEPGGFLAPELYAPVVMIISSAGFSLEVSTVPLSLLITPT